MSNATESNESEPDWIDATAGFQSATGHACDYLGAAIETWSHARWNTNSFVPASHPQRCSEIEQQLVNHLRELTGLNEQQITRCVSATSTELALQLAIVLSRKVHATESVETTVSAKCLCAVGSDHGNGILGAMASGRAEARQPAWPILPGWDHVLLKDLPKRINDQTAMVLISPVDWHAMAKPADAGILEAIAKACQKASASLVIDHAQLPPMGGGHFFVHDSIAKITPDAIILSAGLLGGVDGAVVVLGEKLASAFEAKDSSATDSFGGSEFVATLANASLMQWIANDWIAVDVDEFAVELAQALSAFETIRDMHVTGRTIAIETDVPASEWTTAANQCELEIRPAGDFAIALQPPLVMTDDQQMRLLDRVVQVFELITSQEQEIADESAEVIATADQGDRTDSEAIDSDNIADNTAETGAV